MPGKFLFGGDKVKIKASANSGNYVKDISVEENFIYQNTDISIIETTQEFTVPNIERSSVVPETTIHVIGTFNTAIPPVNLDFTWPTALEFYFYGRPAISRAAHKDFVAGIQSVTINPLGKNFKVSGLSDTSTFDNLYQDETYLMNFTYTDEFASTYVLTDEGNTFKYSTSYANGHQILLGPNAIDAEEVSTDVRGFGPNRLYFLTDSDLNSLLEDRQYSIGWSCYRYLDIVLDPTGFKAYSTKVTNQEFINEISQYTKLHTLLYFKKIS